MSKDSSVSEPPAGRNRTPFGRLLERAIGDDSSIHAVLLYGEEGGQRDSFAAELAQGWLCAQPREDGACGECKPCMQFSRDAAVDLLRIAPSGKSRLIRKQSIRPAKESDEYPVSEFLRTPPLSARNKVIWMADVDRLGLDAANSFLKILEEPPERSRFVLTTQHYSAVLPTIASRAIGVPCEVGTPQELAQDFGVLENWEELWALGSRTRLERLRSRKESWRSLAESLESLPQRPRSAALSVSESWREIAKQLADDDSVPSRTAHCWVLEAVALWAVEVGWRSQAVQHVLESHRKVEGNVQPSLEFDALCATIVGALR
ncbi:MAG TPA: hypothetical protein PLA92_07575 [Fimbriimonadaceae bacterium]|nr:hypothetical protein [Fimbriimonadaceae bacterium]